MRKSLSLVLAMLLLLGIIPTAAMAAETEKWDWLLDTSPVTITLFEDWPTTNVNDEESLAIKRIEEITGVKLERSFPVAWDGQQLVLMLIGETMPDIIVMESSAEWRASFIEQAREADAIWAYDDLIEAYAPHFKELVAPEYFEMFKSSDGKTYEYVNAINTALAEQKKEEFGVVGGADAFARLLYRGIRQADDVERRQALADVRFDGNHEPFHAEQRAAFDFGDYAHTKHPFAFAVTISVLYRLDEVNAQKSVVPPDGMWYDYNGNV